MGDIFFSEYSIGRFPVMLLSLLVTGYFLFRKNRSSTTVWLVIAFISFYMFNAGYFYRLFGVRALGFMGLVCGHFRFIRADWSYSFSRIVFLISITAGRVRLSLLLQYFFMCSR
jgi:hypothetical protein